MALQGTLSSYVPGTREVTRNVDKMSITSCSACNEVFKNAFIMSLLSVLLHSIQQTFIECLHHPYSFSSLVELQRAIAFLCEIRDWCFTSLILTLRSFLAPTLQGQFTWPLSFTSGRKEFYQLHELTKNNASHIVGNQTLIQ